ncbi:hypothetical protein JCM9279_002969 [Rhodotorula babjevae]
MDDTITIRTSDDPPVEFKAARSTLVTGSKVFSDMLSLPQGSKICQEGVINVAETQSEVAPFIRLLNITHDEGKPLEELKVEDWPVVARLADKYDSNAVKGLAIGMYWYGMLTAGFVCERVLTTSSHSSRKWRSNDTEHAAAFRTAHALADRGLIKISLFRLLRDGVQETIDAAMHGQELRFAYWLEKLKLHAFECSMQDVSPVEPCSECVNRPAKCTDGWNSAMRLAMQAWHPLQAGSPFASHIIAAWRVSGLCAKCRRARGSGFDRAYRDSAPDYPL